MGCHSLLQGIFLTRGSNPGLPHCRQNLSQLSYVGSGSRQRSQQEFGTITAPTTEQCAFTEHLPRVPGSYPSGQDLGSLQHIYGHQEGDTHSPAQGFPSLALLGPQRGTAALGLEGSVLAAELTGPMVTGADGRLAVAEAPRWAAPFWPPRKISRMISTQRAWKPGWGAWTHPRGSRATEDFRAWGLRCPVLHCSQSVMGRTRNGGDTGGGQQSGAWKCGPGSTGEIKAGCLGLKPSRCASWL